MFSDMTVLYLLILLVIGVIAGIMIVHLKLKRLEGKLDAQQQNEILLDWVKLTGEGLKQTQQQVSTTMFELTNQLNLQQRNLDTRLDNTARVISDVAREVGQMNELGRSIREVHQLLAAPKLRGNLGEAILSDLLHQILPPTSYNLQHQFKDGTKVDALIITDRGGIPIDAKFPLEQYAQAIKKDTERERGELLREFERAVRGHIKDINQKYLKPNEETTDFALMYIPSEGVYYTIINDFPEVVAFAESKQIHLVSPHSFYFVLRIILLGLREKMVASKTLDILKALDGLRIDSLKMGESLQLSSRHLTNAQGSLRETTKRYEQFQSGLTMLTLDTPKESEPVGILGTE